MKTEARQTENATEPSPMSLLDEKWGDVEAVRNDVGLHVARAIVLAAETLGLIHDSGGNGGDEARKLRRAIALLGKARTSLDVLALEEGELMGRASRVGRSRRTPGNTRIDEADRAAE